MPKTRVYELAKEFGMDSKEFLDRLIAAGIDVSNHMSALEDKDVERVRQEFSDSAAPVVEEKRVAARVIRRRRKSMDVPVEDEVGLTKPEELVSPESEIESPLESMQPAELSEVKEQVEPAVSEEAGEAKAPSPSELEVKTAGEEGEPSEELPAIEIGRDDGAGPEGRELPLETAPEGTTLEEVAGWADAEVPAIEEPPVMESGAAAVVEQEGTETLAERELPSLEPVGEAEEGGEPQEQAAKAVQATEEESAGKTKPKKAKRKRKDAPARIIRMPEPELMPEALEEPPVPEEPPVTAKVKGLRKGGSKEERETPVESLPVEEKVPVKRRAKIGQKADSAVDVRSVKLPKRKEILEREDLYGRDYALSGGKKQKASPRKHQKTAITLPRAIKRRVVMLDSITVGDLAKKIGLKAVDLMKKLMSMGVMVNITQPIDYETATLVAADLGFEVTREARIEDQLMPQKIVEENLSPRPPVITVMGHVDHGKTSLLDYIRHTDVTTGEAGGITQHIGAYKVSLENGELVFLDTPGHEAFTSMRARGALVTDVVILVVAADDGVKQQTKEAIDHARAGNVPIIVAVNKMDKPSADSERVKRELAEYGLLAEDWGGDTILVPVSAKTGQGVKELLEYILLQSELMELKADPTVRARGTVIEAKLDKGRGAVATILVQSGTLRVGDAFVCGKASGRVRAMTDDQGRSLKEAGPATPVEVQGLSEVPNAGDDFVVLEDEKMAREVSTYRQEELWQREIPQSGPMTLEKLYQQIQQGETKELNVVLKADVHGSLEAIIASLQKLETPEVSVRVIHSSTGAITESDVMLASASNAIIIGFNVRPAPKSIVQAEKEHVEIRFYNVIYELLDEIKDAMAGLLEPIYEEKVIGQAEVREVFNISKIGTIAGCYVQSGKIVRGGKARVLRDNVVVYTGEVGGLKRFKEDVREVSQAYECGINIQNYNDVKVGDTIEAFIVEEIKRTLG